MKRLRRCLSFLIACSLLVSASLAIADVKLPAVIGNNMVLQRDMDVPIWGTADASEKVTVTLCGQRATATADAQGRWMVKLKPLKAGGPHNMTVAGRNTITLTNILVGEVWVCSGQSNMQLGVKHSTNAEEEIAAANYPKIRLFTVERMATPEPQTDTNGKWVECSPKTVPYFSAVGYYFGRKLHKTQGVPIGLIDSSHGGTQAEAWTSRGTLESDPDFKPLLDRQAELIANYPKALENYKKRLAKWKKKTAATTKPEDKAKLQRPHSPRGGPNDRYSPGSLYNGMIMPLVPYGIKGTIWYQGEGNTGRGYQYRKLFPAMIQDWRRTWGQGEFPFLFVQLTNFMRRNFEPGKHYWPELREAQLMTLSLPNTGMAVTIDVGEAKNVHPKNKQDVGGRLALAAQALVYNQDIVYSGPIYDSMTVEDARIRLTFKHVAPGLQIGRSNKVGETLTGFTIAGEDRTFVPAEAIVEGDTVVVSSSDVAKPVAVRYGWEDNPACNLYNKAGLPASPFRTDDWPGLTIDER